METVRAEGNLLDVKVGRPWFADSPLPPDLLLGRPNRGEVLEPKVERRAALPVERDALEHPAHRAHVRGGVALGEQVVLELLAELGDREIAGDVAFGLPLLVLLLHFGRDVRHIRRDLGPRDKHLVDEFLSLQFGELAWAGGPQEQSVHNQPDYTQQQGIEGHDPQPLPQPDLPPWNRLGGDKLNVVVVDITAERIAREPHCGQRQNRATDAQRVGQQHLHVSADGAVSLDGEREDNHSHEQKSQQHDERLHAEGAFHGQSGNGKRSTHGQRSSSCPFAEASFLPARRPWSSCVSACSSAFVADSAADSAGCCSGSPGFSALVTNAASRWLSS